MLALEGACLVVTVIFLGYGRTVHRNRLDLDDLRMHVPVGRAALLRAIKCPCAATCPTKRWDRIGSSQRCSSWHFAGLSATKKAEAQEGQREAAHPLPFSTVNMEMRPGMISILHEVPPLYERSSKCGEPFPRPLQMTVSAYATT